MDICNQAGNKYKECWWNLWLWRTIPFLQLMFGTFGNIMNIIILSRKRFQQKSTSVYLICLAVADSLALWTAMSIGVAFNVFGIDLRVTSQVMCKITDWLTFTSGGFSIWLLVLLTIERMMLARFPVFSRSKLTRRSAKLAALACLLVITSLYAHLPFGMELIQTPVDIRSGTVIQESCVPGSVEYAAFLQIAYWFVILIVFNFAPITIMIIGNGLIIATIFLQRKRFNAIIPEVQVQTNSNKKRKSSTRLILLINAFYIFTTVPFVIKKTLETFEPPVNDAERVRSLLSDSVLSLLVYSNYTFNFLLYCVSGSIFNEELRAFLRETKHKFARLCSRSVEFTDGRGSNLSRTPSRTPSATNCAVTNTEF